VEKLGCAQIVVKVRLLGQKTDSLLDFRVSEVASQDPGRTGRGEGDPHQQFQGRSLTRSIGSQKPKCLAGLNREIEALERGDGALFPETGGVVLSETLDFYCVHSHFERSVGYLEVFSAGKRFGT